MSGYIYVAIGIVLLPLLWKLHLWTNAKVHGAVKKACAKAVPSVPNQAQKAEKA